MMLIVLMMIIWVFNISSMPYNFFIHFANDFSSLQVASLLEAGCLVVVVSHLVVVVGHLVVVVVDHLVVVVVDHLDHLSRWSVYLRLAHPEMYPELLD